MELLLLCEAQACVRFYDLQNEDNALSLLQQCSYTQFTLRHFSPTLKSSPIKSTICTAAECDYLHLAYATLQDSCTSTGLAGAIEITDFLHLCFLQHPAPTRNLA